jgi:sulfite exporter TauE/SafE
VLYGLLVSALLMGLAGLPHCAAMCAVPCFAVAPQGVPWRVLLGRTLGYALLGAVAAGAASALAASSRWSQALLPVWVMALAAAALLGGAMAVSGRMPDLVQNAGQQLYGRLRHWMTETPWAQRWPALAQAAPVVLGMAWAALPCGLIYAALTVATLAPQAWGGALVMAVFSLPGAVALWWLPRQMGKIGRMAGSGPLSQQTGRASEQASLSPAPVFWLKPDPAQPMSQAGPTADGAGLAPAADVSGWRALLSDPRWAVRLSGLLLAAAATWALVMRLNAQWQAWCA